MNVLLMKYKKVGGRVKIKRKKIQDRKERK
jgi:hypothetical protein